MKLISEDIIKLLLRVVHELEIDSRTKYLEQDVWDMIEDLKRLSFSIENI